jgi:hypothetical protein
VRRDWLLLTRRTHSFEMRQRLGWNSNSNWDFEGRRWRLSVSGLGPPYAGLPRFCLTARETKALPDLVDWPHHLHQRIYRHLGLDNGSSSDP